MVQLKTRPTDASVEGFLDALGDETRRRECSTLVELMSSVSGAQPRMWGASIVGFGTYHYRYASGREGDWFLTGFAPRKNDLTLYVMAGFDHADHLLGRLGKHKTGKACLYIRRLADIDLAVLRELLAASVRHVQATYGV